MRDLSEIAFLSAIEQRYLIARDLPNLHTITDKIAPRGPDEPLEQEVRKDLSFLFTDFGARVISNRYLPGIGNSELVFEAKTLRFKAVQDWGRIRVSIAPSHAPEDWKDLTHAMMAVRTEVNFESRPEFGSLFEQGEWLRADFTRLEEAFSTGRYPETLVRIKESWKAGAIVWSMPSTYRPSLKILCIRFVAKLLIIPFKMIAWVFRLFFPRKKDRFYPIGSDQAFVKKVREELSFLFTDHGARIISSGYFSSFGNACVTIDAGNIRLRAMRDRNFVSYDFAALAAPWFWNSIERGVVAMKMKDGVIPPAPFPWGIRRLSEYFTELSGACSAENFPQVKRNLELIREASRKEFYDGLELRRQALQSQKVNLNSRRA
jgi:hypothetical protein